MKNRGLSALTLAALTAGCSVEPEGATLDAPQRDPMPSEIVFQAVDAGTGAALADRQMTVRWLVRTPVALDTAAVQRVASTEAYRVRQAVGTDSLVVEVRLEADSYHRHDTVLSVARGGTAGPYTLRMARRLDRTGQAPSRPSAESPSTRPSTTAPPVTRPATRPTASSGFDRTAVAAGDRAYNRQDWSGAVDAYSRMGTPASNSGADGDAYAGALVRLGVSQMNVGAYGGAIDALERASRLPAAGYAAHLHLGRAQCHVGRVQEGRATLGGVGDLSIPAGERTAALALVEYGRGLCSEAEFDAATSTIDRVRIGAAAIRQYETFVRQGEAVSPRTPELTAALDDARTRIAGIQQRVRGD